MTPFEFNYGNGAVRFVHLFNYAEGVTVEDGEQWYFGEHVSQVKKLSGITRYRTWRGLPPIPVPSPYPYDRFVRMTELVFENMALAQQATLGNPSLWAAASAGETGFGEFECAFLDEQPQFDLIKDMPVQQYKYAALPLKFSGGEHQYEEGEDALILVYMFNYCVSAADGEDWYLGHHAREGKLTKQVGLRHYQTWRTLPTPEEPDNPLKPNRLYRLTELGLPAAAQLLPKEGAPSKPQLLITMSQLGNVFGDLLNIIIDPRQVQDLLA
ncbi:MAG: hypothetical protein HOC70_10435 [Gammaproteobacteria bacterium]|jgi:hypothetical protein|nr:hypothetical protein [Gammaproteobacteria bacterium]MBT4493651.1 hypothetical protein [Gammaproteobacteria bacterium]